MSFKETIELPQIDDYRSLFKNNTHFLDVRAPVEFNQGAFPHTENQLQRPRAMDQSIQRPLGSCGCDGRLGYGEYERPGRYRGGSHAAGNDHRLYKLL